VLLENVPGLMDSARYKQLVRELEQLGYPVRGSAGVLNAAHYGVPQRRRRLVVMGVAGHPVMFAGRRESQITVREALAGLATAGISGDPLHDLPERRSARIQAMIAAIPKDGGSRESLDDKMVLTCHRKTDGFKDVYGRMSWDRPAPTITGGCFNPSKGRFLHPEENRAITLREAALLQGFDPNYRFSLDRGKQAAAAMIGNALPPPFVEAQARVLARALLRKQWSPATPPRHRVSRLAAS
jgi:DNA (cytosine-5)-methyltransferase 1